MWEIYYDDIHEGQWFKNLDSRLSGAKLLEITGAAQRAPAVAPVLSYDRPDVILVKNGEPVLVVERTIEVPSGHNVGQRFARLCAAAEAKVPVVYFGPYAARKHGGATEGPRYMNLRLFYALDAVSRVTGTAVATINWKVDSSFEILQTPTKDDEVRAYVSLALDVLLNQGPPALNGTLKASDLYRRLLQGRVDFERAFVKNPEQYAGPPPSVVVCSGNTAATTHSEPRLSHFGTTIVYNVGMRYVRSDPYTGMAMLYRYLYVLESPGSALVLHFPHIDHATWAAATRSGNRKDVRLFRIAGDALILADGVYLRDEF